jgi:beta-lactamase superfamily II metal-dependent hydrolase
MKKALCLILALLFVISITCVGAFAGVTATPNSASVLVNGKSVSFEAYTINENNYFKLRDLAMALNGSEKQFEVGWDGTNNAISLSTAKAYTPAGGELTSSGKTGTQAATLSTSKVYIDGVQANLTAYLIGSNNYFKLRDVGAAINFGVGWDGNANTISINTAVGYTSDTVTLGSLVVHYIDVGQADSLFIELPNKETMLIDAGNNNDGPNVVQYIKAHGYSKITYLVATHPHEDHIGGMVYVVKNLEIGSIYMPKATTTTQTFLNLLEAIQAKGLSVQTAKAGVNIVNISGLNVSILAPNSSQYEDLNNFSAVLKIVYKSNSFLFMGDAETLSENEISGDVSADVLKVGHHGSSSSTGQSFLNKVHPKYAVISVGAGNDYGHPAQSTLDRLSAIGATVYRTDNDGTVVFTSDGTNISVDKKVALSPDTGGGTGHDINASSKDVKIISVNKVSEIVTIRNEGAADVDMTGWVLVSVKGNQRYTFPSYTLKAGKSVTVASGGASGDLFWTSANIWNNSESDPAELYDSQGILIDTF